LRSLRPGPKERGTSVFEVAAVVPLLEPELELVNGYGGERRRRRNESDRQQRAHEQAFRCWFVMS